MPQSPAPVQSNPPIPPNPITVGIDLGTSYSPVAVWHHDHVGVIENDQENQNKSSCVSFTDTKCLIGEESKHKVAMNPHNTVFDTERFMSRHLQMLKCKQISCFRSYQSCGPIEAFRCTTRTRRRRSFRSYQSCGPIEATRMASMWCR